jgi:putative spermidine/putrescine transport system permease protein
MKRAGGSWTVYLLLLPAMFVLIVFFLFPLVLLLSDSFLRYDPTRGMVDEFSLQSYVRILTVPLYGRIIQQTFLISLLVTLLDLALGYPVAYYIARSRSKFKQVAFLSVISPLMVSIVVRSYGWALILDRRGAINSVLQSLGVIKEPLSLMFNYASVTIALVQVLMPYMVLTLSGCFALMDPSLEAAASTLGASKLRTFLTITLPLSTPGIVAGCALVYVLSVGAFAVPLILGGGIVQYLPLTIYDLFSTSFNFPLAAALASTLLLVSLVLTVIYYKCSDVISRENR